MSHGQIITAAVAVLVIVALTVLLINALRGQDVDWRMTYTTRRRHRRGDGDVSQEGEDDDGG